MHKMELSEATEIFETLQGSKHKQEFDDLITCAIKYARIRTDWHIALQNGLDVDENERTYSHDDFIGCCATLSEKMKASGESAEWRFKSAGIAKPLVISLACCTP